MTRTPQHLKHVGLCTCGHHSSEHRSRLPSPCEHEWDRVTIDTDSPGYGCKCLAFSPAPGIWEGAQTSGEILRSARKRHGTYSLRAAADKIGISPSALSKIERDHEKPGKEAMQAALADQIGPDTVQHIDPRQENPNLPAIAAEPTLIPADGEMPVLVLTVGLPRSGKSTWAKAMGCPMVSPDALRLAIHGQAFHSDAEPIVWAIAKLTVVALFLAGHRTVILDACSVSRKRRDEWQDERWQTRYKVFDTNAATCSARAINEGSDYLLPVIERMSHEWQEVTEEEEGIRG